jgi:glycosyltransferase involved in cell wall biosynthesis
MFINVFYFNTLNSIGGIETFFWNLGKKYGKDFDITLFYRSGDPAQIERLSQFIRVRRFREGMKIRCKRAFVCFNTDIMDDIEADEYYQMLHGDYVSLGVYPQYHYKVQKYISVSETVRDAYQKGRGEDSIVSYNPFVPVKPRKVLNLVSATRLTPDKGLNRMIALADALDVANIPYLWTVFTDVPRPSKNPNVIMMKPKLNVIDYIANADYYVQLSNAEGYCYSVVEALSVGTPVIVTDFKVIHEIGVENGKNGWVLPMNMENLPIAQIYKGLKKFKYAAPEDSWADLLVPGTCEDYEDPNKPVKIKCKKVYWDIEFKREMNYGEEWEVPLHRADKLYDLGLIDFVEE